MKKKSLKIDNRTGDYEYSQTEKRINKDVVEEKLFFQKGNIENDKYGNMDKLLLGDK